MPTEKTVCAAVSGFYFGIFWGQGPGSSGNTWKSSETLEGSCCCQVRTG